MRQAHSTATGEGRFPPHICTHMCARSCMLRRPADSAMRCGARGMRSLCVEPPKIRAALGAHTWRASCCSLVPDSRRRRPGPSNSKAFLGLARPSTAFPGASLASKGLPEPSRSFGFPGLPHRAQPSAASMGVSWASSKGPSKALQGLQFPRPFAQPSTVFNGLSGAFRASKGPSNALKGLPGPSSAFQCLPVPCNSKAFQG